MNRRVSAGLYLVVLSVLAGPVCAETVADCSNKATEQLKAAEAEATREWQGCNGDRQCAAQMQDRRYAAKQQITAAYSACRERALGQTPAPSIHWKPGDPSPVAPDGRRYIMTCSGKVLGYYKPGGALEMELKTHPGNCFPNDNPWPGPGTGGGKAVTDYCYEKGTGAWKEYSGGRPSWCDPNR
jgi:hypothetical protein